MILGIDTSCYTTSMVVISEKAGEIIFEKNVMLKVKDGEKGLRQSDGFFQHVHNLTESFETLASSIDLSKLNGIAVSSVPRSIEGSYMPVFNAGVLFCRNLSNALKIPLHEFSHQDGHIMAAISTSSLKAIPNFFYAMHLSGGTTELLKVRWNGKFDIEIAAETLDINFGQLIDRIGVKMGLPFPAGKHLDELACKSDDNTLKKIKIKKDLSFNISGMENHFSKLLGKLSDEQISRQLFNTILDIIKQWIDGFEGEADIIISGGVAASAFLRGELLKHRKNIYFGKPKYSSDNAYGIAMLLKYKKDLGA